MCGLTFIGGYNGIVIASAQQNKRRVK